MKAMPTLRPMVITCGDPAGIGPDIIIKCFSRQPPRACVVIGCPDLFTQRAQHLGVDIDIHTYDEHAPMPTQGLSIIPVTLNVPVICGKPNPIYVPYIIKCLETAVDGCVASRFSAMITAPVSKEVINEAGLSFSGHTEFLAERTAADLPLMLLSAEGLRVALVTTHLPLKDVSAAITKERLEKILRILHTDLRQKLAIPAPVIFICGLNPHAGDGGYLGREEIEVIEPVVKKLKAEGFNLIGPLSADTIFSPENRQQADAFLAMFHDQGLPVLKYHGFGDAVNITLGLPIIRTSVDHGTAFSLAGTGKASDKSLLMAIQQAADMVRNTASVI